MVSVSADMMAAATIKQPQIEIILNLKNNNNFKGSQLKNTNSIFDSGNNHLLSDYVNDRKCQ